MSDSYLIGVKMDIPLHRRKDKALFDILEQVNGNEKWKEQLKQQSTSLA